MVFLPALAVARDRATAGAGRRSSVAVVAMVLVFPIVALFVRDRPQSIGLEPYGATEPVPGARALGAAVPPGDRRPAARPPVAHVLAARRRRFFICGLSTNGLIGTHLIPAAIDHHMTAVAGASLLALMGLFDVDRHDVLRLAHRPARPAPAARLVLRAARPRRDRPAVRVRLGLRARRVRRLLRARLGGDGAADGRAHRRHFGRERVGIVFGWIFAAHQFGAAFAAWAAGASRGWFGSYTTPSSPPACSACSPRRSRSGSASARASASSSHSRLPRRAAIHPHARAPSLSPRGGRPSTARALGARGGRRALRGRRAHEGRGTQRQSTRRGSRSVASLRSRTTRARSSSPRLSASRSPTCIPRQGSSRPPRRTRAERSISGRSSR